MENPISIEPVRSPDGEFQAPPSKAFTLRGLFLAALADGSSVIRNGLHADDQKQAAEALSKFGPDIQYAEGDYIIRGANGNLTAPSESVYTGASGVTTRFIIPLAAAAEGTTKIDGSEQIRSRPVNDLVESLQSAGVQIRTENGHLPVTVTGKSIQKNRTRIEGARSSQFVSGLLIAAPYLNTEFHIEVTNELKSKPYVDITLECMHRFGVDVHRDGYRSFTIGKDEEYHPIEFPVEGDYTSASYFFAAGAVTGGTVRVNNLNPDSTQGDRAILGLLNRMGCDIDRGPDFVDLTGPEQLQAIDIDMSDYPDLVPTIAVVAAFADGKSILRNVDHLRLKESDRLESLKQNLMECGIQAETRQDSIEITGGEPRGGTISPAGDHRIAMAFSVLGLGGEGVVINNPEVVNKSFPGYYNELFSIYDN